MSAIGAKRTFAWPGLNDRFWGKADILAATESKLSARARHGVLGLVRPRERAATFRTALPKMLPNGMVQNGIGTDGQRQYGL